jgi:acetone carboxylase gamma subunit
MSKFRVGMKVRCVKGYTYSKRDKVIDGKNYYVREVADASRYIYVNNDEPSLSWPSHRFIKVPSNGR